MQSRIEFVLLLVITASCPPAMQSIVHVSILLWQLAMDLLTEKKTQLRIWCGILYFGDLVSYGWVDEFYLRRRETREATENGI